MMNRMQISRARRHKTDQQGAVMTQEGQSRTIMNVWQAGTHNPCAGDDMGGEHKCLRRVNTYVHVGGQQSKKINVTQAVRE